MDRRMEWGRRGDVGTGVWEVSVWSYTIKAILKGNTKWPPPPFPSTSLPSLPLWPGPLLSPPLRLPPLPLFPCTESAPWMDQVYFILLLHVLQTPNSPISTQPLLFSSTSPPFLFPASTSLLQDYKSLSRPDRQRRREKQRGGLKHRRQEGRRGRKSWDESEMKLQLEQRAKTVKYEKQHLTPPLGIMYPLWLSF